MEWISIKDKLPPEDETVVLFSEPLFESGDFPLFIRSFFKIDDELITHWISLPLLPKE